MVTNKNHPDPFPLGKVIDFLLENNLFKEYERIVLRSDEQEIIEKMEQTFGSQNIISALQRAESQRIKE